jgi:hypothetical protein
MADICPICGKPHGRGLPALASVEPGPIVPIQPTEVVLQEPADPKPQTTYSEMSIAELRSAAKEAGINSFGMKKADLVVALEAQE